MLNNKQKKLLENQIYKMLKESMFENGFQENFYGEGEKKHHEEKPHNEHHEEMKHDDDKDSGKRESVLRSFTRYFHTNYGPARTKILQEACLAKNIAVKIMKASTMNFLLKKSIHCIAFVETSLQTQGLIKKKPRTKSEVFSYVLVPKVFTSDISPIGFRGIFHPIVMRTTFLIPKPITGSAMMLPIPRIAFCGIFLHILVKFFGVNQIFHCV